MELFEMIGDQLFPSIHALMIEPFKSMWENDDSERKADCLKDFRYIELLCSPRKSNPYFGYAEEVRPRKVKEKVYGDKDYAITDMVMLGIIEYKEQLSHASPAYDLLNSALVASQKLTEYLITFNLGERTPGGAMVIKPADITRALKEIPETAKSIALAREKVHFELIEDSKTRKDREPGEFEE